MSTRRFALAAVLVALTLAVDTAPAQVARARGYNPMTGRVGTAGAAYNPLTGGAARAGAARNPFTGTTGKGAQYHNPMTGRTTTAGAKYNPYTGNYRYGVYTHK